MLLEATSIEAGYGASQVLFGIDLRVGAGEVMALLGRNGMGKSTLLKVLTGTIAPMCGGVQFCGAAIGGQRPDAIAKRRQHWTMSFAGTRSRSPRLGKGDTRRETQPSLSPPSSRLALDSRPRQGVQPSLHIRKLPCPRLRSPPRPPSPRTRAASACLPWRARSAAARDR